jgi:hypothetical protein
MSPILKLIIFLVLAYFVYYAYYTYYVVETAKIYDIQTQIGSFITKDTLGVELGDLGKTLTEDLNTKLDEYKTLNTKLESDLVEINLKIEAYKKSSNDMGTYVDSSILKNMIKIKEEIMSDVFKNIDILKSNLMTTIANAKDLNENASAELAKKIEKELKTEVDRISFMINNLSLDLKKGMESNIMVSNQLSSKIDSEVNKLVGVDNMLGSQLTSLNTSITKLIDDVKNSSIGEFTELKNLNVESIKKVNDDLILINSNIGLNSSGLKELKESTLESIKKLNADISTNDAIMKELQSSTLESIKRVTNDLSLINTNIALNSNGLVEIQNSTFENINKINADILSNNVVLQELKASSLENIKKVNDDLTLMNTNIQLNSVGIKELKESTLESIKNINYDLISNSRILQELKDSTMSNIKMVNDALAISNNNIGLNSTGLRELNTLIVENMSKVNADILSNAAIVQELKSSTLESIKQVNNDLTLMNTNIGLNSAGLKELKESTLESIKKMTDILTISENDIRSNSNGLKELKESTLNSIQKINDIFASNAETVESTNTKLNNISNDIKNIVKKYDDYIISNDSYVKGLDNRLLLSENSIKGNVEELNNLKNIVTDNISKINQLNTTILLNEEVSKGIKAELSIISNDLKNVIKNYEDYVFSNNSYTQKLNDRVENYINQNYLAIKNINDSIDIINYGMGDIRLLNGVDITSTLLNIKKQLNVYDGDHAVLIKLKSDLEDMKGVVGSIEDINKLKDGFYNHSKILNRLVEVEDILKSANIVLNSNDVNYAKYKANKESFKGLNNTKREQMFLINDTIESLEKYVSGLILSNDNKNIIRDLINISKNELYEINGKDTLVSYLNNIQFTTGQLWSDSNVKDIKLNNIENSLNLMTEVVGEVSLLNKNSIVDSIQKIQLDVRKLNEDGIEVNSNLNSFKNSVNEEVKKIGDVIKYNSIVDTLVGDVQVLMNRTGTGNIRYKDLATSAENLYNDLQTQTSILHLANKDISSMKSILGNYVAAEQGGDIAQIIKDMNTNLKYLYSNLGSYRKDDFNQMTVDILLKDIITRINGVELFSLNNKNTSRDLADLISKVSDLKTFVGSEVGNNAVSTSLVDRINSVELKLVDLVNITNSSNYQQTNMKTSIDYLNKYSDEIRPLIANFSFYLESIENIKPVGPNISQSIINLFNSVNSNSDSIGKVSNLVDTLNRDVNKTISEQVQFSTKLNELYSSLDKVNASVISINNSLFSQKVSIDDIKTKIDLISQVSFLPKLVKALSDISKSYPLLKNDIDSIVPTAVETVSQINLFLEKYKSDTRLVEWQSNYEFYSYISKIQIGLTEMYAAMEDKIKFGATVDPFNQTDMNKLVPMYMYNYFNEPFIQYLSVMNEWVENTPIWYQLGKSKDDIDSINKSVNTFNNDILFLKAYKGNMETEVNGILTKLNNIGNWDPVIMNSTLSNALMNIISKNTTVESNLNNMQTIVGNLSNINYPSISSAVVDLLSKVKSIEDKDVINSKDIESVKASSSKLLSIVGEYNGNLLADLTSIKQNLTNVESNMETHFSGIGSRLDKVEYDLKYSTIATLVNNVQILARFDPKSIIYDTITEYHKFQVNPIPQAAKEVNINTLTNWKPLFLNIDTVVKLRNLLNALALDKLPMISMLEYQKINNIIYLTAINTKTAIESLLGVDLEKNIQLHVVEILDNYKLLTDKVNSIQTSSGNTGDQVANLIIGLKPLITSVMNYKHQLVQTSQTIAVVDNMNSLSTEIDKYKTGFANDAFFDLLKDTVTKMNNSTVFNGKYTGTDESIKIMTNISKSFFDITNQIFSTTNQSIPDRLRQIWIKAGNYTGVSIQGDINDLNSRLTTLTTNFNTFNTNTSASLISLDNRVKSLEADIVNIKAATASTSGSTNLSIPETILPPLSVPIGTYYAICTIQNGNIISQVYPATYTGLKYPINMPISTMEYCILTNPANIAITYMASYIQQMTTPTRYTLGGSEGTLIKYITSPLSYGTSPDTTILSGGGPLSYGNVLNMTNAQVNLGTSLNALNIINSAKYLTLKARDNSIMTFQFQVVITTAYNMPEFKVNTVDKMFTLNNALSRSNRVPVVDSNPVINFTKGFILDKKYSNEQPSCSLSSGIYTCNCPANSYVCGVNYTSMNNAVSMIRHQCCSFNF